MAQNNGNSNKRMQKVDSRPTLISAKHSNKITVEKLREILRHVNSRVVPERMGPRCPRDFTAYFHSSTKITDPTYGVTSHDTRGQLSPQKVPSYAVTQALRWDPNVETATIDTYSDEPEHNTFNCTCTRCTSERCPSKGLYGDKKNSGNQLIPLPQTLHNYTPKPLNMNAATCGSRISAAGRSGFKDNIMRFNNQSTMTSTLKDSCIGCMPSELRYVSEASATTSDIAVKETLGNMRLHKKKSMKKCRSPILKKRRLRSAEIPSYSGESSNQSQCPSEVEESICSGHRGSCYIIHPPHRRHTSKDRSAKVDLEYPQEKRSARTFFKFSRRKPSKERYPRRNIYNEGISDLVAQQHSGSASYGERVRDPDPVHVPRPQIQRNFSKYCMKSISRFDGESSHTPYCHRSESRYHTNCKKSGSKHYMLEEEEARYLQSPEALMRSFMSRKTNCHNHCAPGIQLPKRVLTSDRDIDTFIESSYKKFCVPSRCCRR